MAVSEGVDLEWAIVELSRINQNKQSKTTRNYSDKIKKQANECIKHLNDKLGNSYEIYHSDEKNIYAKPEPKTDIIIISKSKKYLVSVKMEGSIQLASGQGQSTAELFESAAESLKDSKAKKVVTSIIKELKVIPTRLLSQSNISRIKKEGNNKIIDEFIKNGKVIQEKSYEYWLENNKEELLEAILDFSQKNKNFYNALLYEALTGEKTLKQFKDASANYIISPSGFYVIDEKYIEKIKSKIKVDLRAKSRGGITSVAFRIETRGSV